MRQIIDKYKGLSNKELTLAYSRARTSLTRTANRAALESEQQLSTEDVVSRSYLKKLEKLDQEMIDLQSELDAIGMLKAGRF